MDMLTVVVGLGYGDEGKGRVVDYLAKDYDAVVRFNGGPNAGHTIVSEGKKYVLHVVPSGSISGKRCYVGSGVVIDPEKFKQEIRSLVSEGISFDIKVSERCHVILKKHIEEDEKDRRLGTTKQGVGPCNVDKVSRKGVLMKDYSKIDPEFERYLCDVSVELNRMISEGKNIIFEAAQGSGIDLSHGTYCYVTTSHSTAGGASVGTGVPPKFDRVIGVVRSIPIRVGEGPFVTELGSYEELKNDKTPEGAFSGKLLERINSNTASDMEIGKYFRIKGSEYGATTGRPRRIGWMDVPMTRYYLMINGVDEIFLTKLDILSGLKRLKICDYYEKDGKKTDYSPINLQGATPHYIEMEGWHENISKAKSLEELPENARKYIKKLESLFGVKISHISVGPERNQVIVCKYGCV